MTDRSDNPPIAFLHALANIFLPKLLIWLVERGLVEGNPTARQGTQPENTDYALAAGPELRSLMITCFNICCIC